ncbi:hypothetical protein GYMLUDRAFT_63381 [Collybiopsis luxurians FD-317 M1]|uniref:Uncharacterized protein n=1 Tax=Collybiopsis luxurians FD-317 M1 TaxID=944289 RepID=A0A0D0BWJ4_9AGAR|nr:hypothetical protein GYMLUDRAFT_63381 [Collybiopsis luxurians FD-317 M1]
MHGHAANVQQQPLIHPQPQHILQMEMPAPVPPQVAYGPPPPYPGHPPHPQEYQPPPLPPYWLNAPIQIPQLLMQHNAQQYIGADFNVSVPLNTAVVAGTLQGFFLLSLWKISGDGVCDALNQLSNADEYQMAVEQVTEQDRCACTREIYLELFNLFCVPYPQMLAVLVVP